MNIFEGICFISVFSKYFFRPEMELLAEFGLKKALQKIPGLILVLRMIFPDHF